MLVGQSIVYQGAKCRPFLSRSRLPDRTFPRLVESTTLARLDAKRSACGTDTCPHSTLPIAPNSAYVCNFWNRRHSTLDELAFLPPHHVHLDHGRCHRTLVLRLNSTKGNLCCNGLPTSHPTRPQVTRYSRVRLECSWYDLNRTVSPPSSASLPRKSRVLFRLRHRFRKKWGA